VIFRSMVASLATEASAAQSTSGVTAAVPA
jgi:hypothetical protein